MNLTLELLAAGRGGWFSRQDAIVAGYTDADLRREVSTGRWVRLTRGGYAIAGPDAALHESVDVEPQGGGVGDILPIGAQD